MNGLFMNLYTINLEILAVCLSTAKLHVWQYRTIYSGTSDSGPSEIGTLYNKPLYKGHCSRSMPYSFSTLILEPLKEDNLSIKDKVAEFILSPTCPLFRGSTVNLLIMFKMRFGDKTTNRQYFQLYDNRIMNI